VAKEEARARTLEDGRRSLGAVARGRKASNPQQGGEKERGAGGKPKKTMRSTLKKDLCHKQPLSIRGKKGKRRKERIRSP